MKKGRGIGENEEFGMKNAEGLRKQLSNRVNELRSKQAFSIRHPHFFIPRSTFCIPEPVWHVRLWPPVGFLVVVKFSSIAHLRLILLVFFASLLCFVQSGLAQTVMPPKHILDQTATKIYPAINYPRNPTAGDLVFGLALDLTIAPRQVVRDEIRQIPQLVGSMRLGLPAGFGVGVRLAGNYIANEFSISPSWSYSFGPFSVAVQDVPSIWLGAADFSGFSAFGMGFTNEPGITAGVQVDDFLLSAGANTIASYWHYTKFGPDVVKRSTYEFEGEAFTLAVEQDAFGNRRINWGVRFNYTRPGYQLWLAFSDTRQRILQPEFFFGMIL